MADTKAPTIEEACSRIAAFLHVDLLEATDPAEIYSYPGGVTLYRADLVALVSHAGFSIVFDDPPPVDVPEPVVDVDLFAGGAS